MNFPTNVPRKNDSKNWKKTGRISDPRSRAVRSSAAPYFFEGISF